MDKYDFFHLSIEGFRQGEDVNPAGAGLTVLIAAVPGEGPEERCRNVFGRDCSH